MRRSSRTNQGFLKSFLLVAVGRLAANSVAVRAEPLIALVFGKSPRISAHCSAAIRSISAFSAASRAFRRGAQRADLFMFSRLWHRLCSRRGTFGPEFEC